MGLRNQKESTGLFLTPTQSFRLMMAIILGALSAFGPLSIDMYLPSLPSMARELQTSESLTQLSLTACLLGLSLGQLLVGPQSDIKGRRGPLLWGLVVYTLSSFLCALSPSIWMLIILRFIQGFAGSAGIVISRAVMRDLYSGSEMIKFSALLMLINGVAPILAPVLGAQILWVTSWRGVFFVLSAVGILMLLAVLFSLPETLPLNKRSSAGFHNTLTTFRILITDRSFMGYALPQGLVAAAMFAYISGSPFVIQNIYGASPQLFSLFFAINGLGIILAGQITGRLASRISAVKLFVSGIILASLGGTSLLTAILLGAGLPGILPPLFFVVSSLGIVGSSGTALAMEKYGHSAGSASALLGLFSFIFGAVFAPLVGIAGSNTALPMGIIIAITDVSALVFYLVLRKPSK